MAMSVRIRRICGGSAPFLRRFSSGASASSNEPPTIFGNEPSAYDYISHLDRRPDLSENAGAVPDALARQLSSLEHQEDDPMAGLPRRRPIRVPTPAPAAASPLASTSTLSASAPVNIKYSAAARATMSTTNAKPPESAVARKTRLVLPQPQRESSVSAPSGVSAGEIEQVDEEVINAIPAPISESRQSTVLSPPQGFFDGKYQKEILQETQRRARIMQRTGQPFIGTSNK